MIKIGKCIITYAILGNVTLACTQAAHKAGQWSAGEWAWTTEKWTGDERPYRRMRIYINKFVRQGQNPTKLSEQYKKQAKSWMNTQAQFRWAYAAYESAGKAGFVNQERVLEEITSALKRAADASPPRNYEYSRLRFLALVRLLPEHRLKTIGERLVQHNPKDHETRFYLATVLDPGRFPDEEKPALEHAQFLVRALPEKPTVYSLLGEVYWKIWIRTAKEEDADKSIAAYRKFLQVAPPNHRFRKGAEAQIKLMESMKASRAKKTRHATQH